MTHAKSTPIVWEDNKYYSRKKYISDESKQAIRNLFIENFGEEFTNKLEITREGNIEISYLGKKLFGREKAGVVQRIKSGDATFDITKHEKKYLEMKATMERNLEYEAKRKNRDDAIQNFIESQGIKGLKYSKYGRDFSLDTAKAIVSITEEGLIESFDLYAPSMTYTKIDDAIITIQEFITKRDTIRATIVGKNIYSI